MSKYIDAEKLIAEIESRMEDCKLPDGKFPTTTNIVRYEELSCLRNYITSLQQEQPEVDLSEETIAKEFHIINDRCFNEGIEGWQKEKLIARHFYELGLNARKEE